MELRGDICQCPACKLYFKSTAAFDKHRVGSYTPPTERRCMTEKEMRESGMDTNARGLWVTKLNPKYQKENES